MEFNKNIEFWKKIMIFLDHGTPGTRVAMGFLNKFQPIQFRRLASYG